MKAEYKNNVLLLTAEGQHDTQFLAKAETMELKMTVYETRIYESGTRQITAISFKWQDAKRGVQKNETKTD